MNKKHSTIGIVLIFVLGLAGISLFVVNKQEQEKQKIAQERIYKEKQEVREGELEEEVAKIETANWKIYRNEKYDFEVKYPENWGFTETYYKNKGVGDSFSFTERSCLEESYNDETYCEYFARVSVFKDTGEGSLFPENRAQVSKIRHSSDACIKNNGEVMLQFVDQLPAIEMCRSNSYGYVWDVYYFKNNGLGYGLLVKHNNPDYKPVIERKILESFKLIEK